MHEANNIDRALFLAVAFGIASNIIIKLGRFHPTATAVVGND